MKLVACFAISTSLLGLMAPAQSNPSASDSSGLSGEMCPVHMRALQGTGHGLLAVRDDHKAPAPECPLDKVGTSANCPSATQRIHLILGNPAAKTYARATVFVLGFTPKGRLERTDSFANGTSEISKTLEVTFAPEDEKSMSADIVLPGFSSVTSVQLKSITYRDGSSWKVNGGAEQTCRVVPDPVMLIAGP